MARKGLTVKDLEPMIGKSNRVYEILNHKLALTLKMIWKLHEGMGIPAEPLIKPAKAQALMPEAVALRSLHLRQITCITWFSKASTSAKRASVTRFIGWGAPPRKRQSKDLG